MTEALRPWLDMPFAIFGHSMGALLAFEWVRRLEREQGPQPVHLIVTGRCAPDCPQEGVSFTSLSDTEFIEELSRVYEGLSDELRQEEELMQVMLPILRADLAVVESYKFQEGEPLSCPITTFAGAEDATVSYEQLLGWQRQTRGEFTAGLVPGGHFFPQEHLLGTIARLLETSPVSRSAY